MKMTESAQAIQIDGVDFKLAFDKKTGQMASLQREGKDLVEAGPKLNFWRAPTENDLTQWSDERAALRWREVGYDQLEERTVSVKSNQVNPQAVQVKVHSVIQVREGVELPKPKVDTDLINSISMGLNFIFDVPQLKTLCLRLGIDYESLHGVEKTEKLRSLMRHILREDQMYELLKTTLDMMIEIGLPVPDEFDQLVRAGKDGLQTKPKPPARFECETQYMVYGSGDIQIEAHVLPDPGLPFLPRLGFQMTLPEGYERFTWYGRGPHENYSDRCEGAAVGIYSGTVDEQYVPYIVPEENGNKTEVRWVTLTGPQGTGLLAVGSPIMEVSAHHFTTQNLTEARHTYELKRRPEIILNLDYGQSGLGSAACGPGRLEQYQLKAVETRFSLRLRPFSAKADSPVKLSKQNIK
jgi:beta-galactosidase